MAVDEFSEQGPWLLADGRPAPALLDALIARAVREGATDIHLDLWGEEGILRFRVDGQVYAKASVAYEEGRRLLNQLKIAADLNTEVIHRPLEGQFRWSLEGMVRDARVTLIPTAPRHESAHIRLLTTFADWRGVEHLGLNEKQLEHLRQVVRSPHGLILVAGPTGSGKTTTLYALTGLDDIKQRIVVSIEEPAEFDLPYVRQLEVDERRGLTMAEGLRTLLRMDPDVLLIGEIRDEPSATIAAQAALSGRLVLATIHARDAAGAVHAMIYRSVPYPILGGALRMVIAQNLVRMLCRHCRRRRSLEPFEVEIFARFGVDAPEEVEDARGCSECSNHGYRGQVGIFQMAVLDDEMGLWLAEGRAQQEIRRRFAASGAEPLAVQALRRVANHETSMSEAMRFVEPRSPGEIQDLSV